MKLIDALRLNAERRPGLPPFRVLLATGFTPLHLASFLQAELQTRLRGRRVELSIAPGFGDLAGTIRTAPLSALDAIAVVIEWSDLDARLGLRQLGGWGPHRIADILEHAALSLGALRELIGQTASALPVALALPALPLPPLFTQPGWQSGAAENQLRALVASFAAGLDHPNVRVLNSQRLDALSAPAARVNLRSDWSSGFPYELAHAGTAAHLLALLVANPQPRKGIITDLDDTLWSGIVGDAGVENVAWDLDNHAQAHGVYQQMLATLAAEGVLVGVASKNDPAVVRAVFERPEILLQSQHVFPFEVSWGSKAEAVSRILAQWNITADSVVFIDDNPLELEQVREAHPDIDCRQFPANPEGVYQLIGDLRDLFGKQRVSEEDAGRLASIRSNVVFQGELEGGEGFSESVLEKAEAEVTLSFEKSPADARAFELINKTNQFNLNGKRFSESDWQSFLQRPEAFLLTAAYKDRFGSLGKIAVLAGRVQPERVDIDVWVMSCRAFARRIEHQCLRRVCEKFRPAVIGLGYQETPRNGPVKAFLEDIGSHAAPPVEIAASTFLARCPKLFHTVKEKN